MSSGFVSEVDLAERRKVRKEMWEKNKKDSDPDEPPEEPAPDHRSLYERLKEQKDKKQEDWEEAHKLKNMVRGLEDDEVDFLELVDNTKMQEEKRIREEELTAIQEYRKKVSQMQQKAIEAEVLSELKPESKRPATSGVEKKKSSQISLLAGAIKRKKSDDDSGGKEKNAKIKTSESSSEEQHVGKTIEEITPKTAYIKNGLQCVAILPGLGEYTDSSDSENSETDSELESCTKIMLPRDLTGRIIHLQAPSGGKGCC
ncbi:UNVERIFIED_CONTAM: hypothetical protein RMT77_011324 [Armadillidium vulgare]